MNQSKAIPLHFLKIKSLHQKFPPLVILHGLLGNHRNFYTLSNKVFKEKRDIYLVDLRNHGQSPWDNEITYEAMQNDLKEFLDKEKIDHCDLLGFSMGGKVSMSFCLQQPNSEQRIRKLIIGDIAPVNHGVTSGGVPHILNSIVKCDISQYKDRREVDKALQKDIPNDKERGFVLTNLVVEGDKLKWKANVIELQKNLPTIMSFPNTLNIYRNPSLFLRGSNSNLVDEKYYERIQDLFPNYNLSVFEGKGHWIHEEDPVRFSKEVTEFLDQ